MWPKGKKELEKENSKRSLMKAILQGGYRKETVKISEEKGQRDTPGQMVGNTIFHC